jgi:uncharacterized RDD family membrane protein YckC
VKLTSGIVYAGFWRRLAATLIDGFILIPILILVAWLAGGGELGKEMLDSDPLAGIDPMVSLTMDIGLFLVVIGFWVRLRGTPGKLLMGCELVDARTGEALGIGRAILRWFAYLLSALPLFLGFAWIAFDRHKQGLHDKIAGSLVIISDDSRKSLQELEQEAH